MTCYLNDHITRTSRQVSITDVPEIAGIGAEEFSEKYDNNLEELNADLYEFDFSTEPKYND